MFSFSIDSFYDLNQTIVLYKIVCVINHFASHGRRNNRRNLTKVK